MNNKQTKINGRTFILGKANDYTGIAPIQVDNILNTIGIDLTNIASKTDLNTKLNITTYNSDIQEINDELVDKADRTTTNIFEQLQSFKGNITIMLGNDIFGSIIAKSGGIEIQSTTSLSLSVASGSAINVNGARIVGLGTPLTNSESTTKLYVDNGLSLKQDKLIAGANIAINPTNNTISLSLVEEITLTSDSQGLVTFNPKLFISIASYTSNAKPNDAKIILPYSSTQMKM